MPRTYNIHDNRGRPFRVVVDGKHVEVYRQYPTEKHIGTYTVEDVHVGKSSGTSKVCDHTKAQARQFDGNSILLHMGGHKYIYIGHEIYSFEMKDDLVKYYSPVGNNDVPYPHVLGTEYVYFLLEKRYVARDLFPAKLNWEEAYIPWMGTFDPKTGWDSPLEDASKRLRTKQIAKRIL